jgi:glutamyl-tRNA synthetase
MKLSALNGEKIRELDLEDFVGRIRPFLVRDGVVHEPVSDEELAVLRRVAPLLQTRIKRLDEAPGWVRFLFYEPEPDEKAAALLTSEHASELEVVEELLTKTEPWSEEKIREALLAWADATGRKRKDAMRPIYAAISGSLFSLPLFDSIEVLGRDRSVARLRNAAGRARHGS